MVIVSIVACATIPADLAQSERGLGFARREPRQNVLLIETSLVRQGGRKE